MEHIKQQSDLPALETVLEVAEELFGKESSRVSDIRVILEEDAASPAAREKIVEDAIGKMIEGIEQEKMQMRRFPHEMMDYFLRLRVPPARIDVWLHRMYPDNYPPPQLLPNYGRPDKLHS